MVDHCNSVSQSLYHKQFQTCVLTLSNIHIRERFNLLCVSVGKTVFNFTSPQESTTQKLPALLVFIILYQQDHHCKGRIASSYVYTLLWCITLYRKAYLFAAQRELLYGT